MTKTLPFFVNGDRHIFPHKNARGLNDFFYITFTMDILLIYNSKDKVSERIILLEFSSLKVSLRRM